MAPLIIAKIAKHRFVPVSEAIVEHCVERGGDNSTVY